MFLVISQSMYAGTVILQLIYNQFTCFTCSLQLFYCLLTDFTVFLQSFYRYVKVIFTIIWTGRAGQVGPGRVAGRGPGQACRGVRLLYSDLAVRFNYTIDLRAFFITIYS